MLRYTNIQARSWQLKLGAFGEVVTDLEDIAQCIRIIATTPKGSVPMRPEFGSDAFDYLDRPINIAGPHLIRSTFESIVAFEPRAVVEKVIPRATDAGIELEILWHPAGSEAAQQSKVTL